MEGSEKRFAINVEHVVLVLEQALHLRNEMSVGFDGSQVVGHLHEKRHRLISDPDTLTDRIPKNLTLEMSKPNLDFFECVFGQI